MDGDKILRQGLAGGGRFRALYLSLSPPIENSGGITLE